MRNQEEALRRYCDTNSIQVQKIYIEDHSAKSFHRPEWIKLIADLKRTKGKAELLLFTKWDCFSRNAGDAYQVLNSLNKLGVEAQAIEQPLDLTIPENKMMLAVYLAAPEVENDRRALNVIYGMRRAKKEGRWMSTAPIGYVNRTSETGRKYIAPKEPEASLLKWAFKELAKGVSATEHVWKQARKKGLKISRNNFWRGIRNPVYCVKIFIPKYKKEEAQLVRGLHEPIISEDLFYTVQDVLDGRRIGLGVRVTSEDSFPLRGFLKCPKCEGNLTGSASKGRSRHYHYYHCQPPCQFRIKAEDANQLMIEELRKYVPHPAILEVYKEVVREVNASQSKQLGTDRKQMLNKMEDLNKQLHKARELLLTGAIEPEYYKEMKTDIEGKITCEEARLSLSSTVVRNIQKLLDEAGNALSKLDQLYINGSTKQKREIIGSIFPEKLVIAKSNYRTAGVNEAASLMYLINN